MVKKQELHFYLFGFRYFTVNGWYQHMLIDTLWKFITDRKHSVEFGNIQSLLAMSCYASIPSSFSEQETPRIAKNDNCMHSHQLACRSRNNEGSIHVNPQQPCPKKHCVEVMSFREEAIRWRYHVVAPEALRTAPHVASFFVVVS